MQKKVYSALDIAKFISAFLVICIHTGPLLDISETGNFILVQVLARIAVPLFFIISGFLFFSKLDDDREWNDDVNIRALKRYVFRLIKIYVIWTILYLPFQYLILRGTDITMMTFLRFIRDFFFTGSYYHLWFLPALIFSVCAVYFLRRHVSMMMTLVICFILYLIGMAGNVYPQLWDQIPVAKQLYSGYINIFETFRNGLFFGMMFIALGSYFAKKRMLVSRSLIAPFIGFVLSLAALFVEAYLLREHGFMRDLTCMYLMLVPTVSFLLVWLLSLDLKPRAIYQKMRTWSLLIYVSHIMFVVVLSMVLPQADHLLRYGLTVVLSIVFALLLDLIAQKITVLQHLYR